MASSQRDGWVRAGWSSGRNWRGSVSDGSRQGPPVAGRRASSGENSGGGRFSDSSSCPNRLRLVTNQEVTSSSMWLSVKSGRDRRSDSRTLVRIVRRRAPRIVLLVRPVFRSLAASQKVRSDSLFVPGTSEWITKVNSSSDSISRRSSLTRLTKSCSVSVAGGVSFLNLEPHKVHRSSSNTLTFFSRVAASADDPA